MKTKSKPTNRAPQCVFCGKSSGVQFAIFNPKFPPFGTACVACEAIHDRLPGADGHEGQQKSPADVWAAGILAETTTPAPAAGKGQP